MVKKIIDIKTRLDASRGRKAKAGGEKKIKSDSIIYIPWKKRKKKQKKMRKKRKMKEFKKQVVFGFKELA